MKILSVLSLIPLVVGFDFNKFIATSAISSLLTLPHSSVNMVSAYEQPSMPVIQTEQMEGMTNSISISKNNLYIYGSITASSCEQLKNQLLEMDYNARVFKITYNMDPPPINLHIQSGGGSLMNAFYIVDLIQDLETPVHTYVDGYAASAASLMSVVGNKRYMTKNSAILIHQLSSEKKGKYQELEDDMKNMQQFMEKIKKIYLAKTNIALPKLNELLSHDLWLDAETCKNLGLVDEII
jgi:ATP-dependent protease ClpP protease subunit